MNAKNVPIKEIIQLLEVVESLHSLDAYSAGHCWRVSDYAHLIGDHFGLTGKELLFLLVGGVVHDIGKHDLPIAIIQKPGKLERHEREQIELHSVLGAERLKDNPLMPFIQSAILQHHERLDGSGYPFGLIGDEISIYGRIIAIADVYDALTSNRPYRDMADHEDALQFLKENSGIQFDGELIKIFESIPFERIQIIKRIGNIHPLSSEPWKDKEIQEATRWHSLLLEHDRSSHFNPIIK
jgi:HD-GYP domain-containing protein (c-di-GMP phosphodiesterase class II)